MDTLFGQNETLAPEVVPLSDVSVKPLAGTPAIFVTGTDTNVGKTIVSAMLMLGLKARYWKPIQSGIQETTDSQWIQSATGLPNNHFLSERFKLSQPLSPHAAAKIDGVKIELDAFELPDFDSSSPLIVEGAGGLMVPLNSKCLIIDLIDKLQIPVLLVARSTLGTINHTLLSLAQLRQRGIPILGVVMNGPHNPSNREAIEHYGQVSVLGELGILPQLDRDTLLAAFHQTFEAPR